MAGIKAAAFVLFVCGTLIAEEKGEKTASVLPEEAGIEIVVPDFVAVPAPHELIEFLKADRNYWERLAMTNAAESSMLQSTAGKTWLAHKEMLKGESMAHTRASALMNAACLKLGKSFVFVRKSLTCELEESAALAGVGIPTGNTGAK